MDIPLILAYAVPAVPFLSFAITALITRRLKAVSAGISICAIAVSLVLSVFILSDQITVQKTMEGNLPWLYIGELKLTVGVLVNPLTALMLVVVTSVSFLVQVYSIGYMKGDVGFGRFFSYLSLFSFSMLTLVVANNFILLYMGWELVGLSSYLLIGFWYHKPEAARAARKAFVVTRFGDFGLLVGIIIFGFLASEFSFSGVSELVASGSIAPGMLTILILLLFTGAIGKSGQFPLHVWLPDAMEGPTPVSALIHAATMVAAGVFLVARLFGIFSSSADAMLIIAYLGGFTAIFSAFIALAQEDIKRVLAYSTISQLGYMMMALGLGGYGAGMFHLTTHAAFKALLFLCAGSVIHAIHTNDIFKMGGLIRKMPLTAVTFAIAGLALSGVFPFSGFFSKDEILAAAFDSGRMELYIIGVLTAFLTAFYISRVFFTVFMGKGAAESHAHESPPVMTVPLLIFALLSAGLGIIGIPGSELNVNAFLSNGEAAHVAGFNLTVAIQSNIAALSGILAAFIVYGARVVKHETIRKATGVVYLVLKNKFYVDELYELLIRTVFYGITRIIAWFDRHVVDGAVNLVGWLVKKSGAVLSRTIPGRIQDYAFLIFFGVLGIVLFIFFLFPDILIFAGGR